MWGACCFTVDFAVIVVRAGGFVVRWLVGCGLFGGWMHLALVGLVRMACGCYGYVFACFCFEFGLWCRCFGCCFTWWIWFVGGCCSLLFALGLGFVVWVCVRVAVCFWCGCFRGLLILCFGC